MDNIYTTGEYLEANPQWHVEDSPWKARKIFKMLRLHDLQPSRVAEVGCGAGGILRELYRQLAPTTEFHGFEISPDAYQLAKKHESDRLQFHLADLTEQKDVFDLLLVIDVFEHVEDYLGFLRALRSHGSQFIFHVPLDLSAQTVARRGALTSTRSEVGHLHYFTEGTALATLEDSGYVVEDYFFTARGIDIDGGGLKRKLARLPRKLLSYVSESLASRLLGGFSIMVLARPSA